MRSSTVLYVRQLLARLHPPLPTTPKESQQLLQVLETSFRRHLDEVHPSPALGNTNEGVPSSNIPISTIEATSSVARSHLDSVLRHPLLAVKHVGGKNGKSLCNEAIEHFDHAIASSSLPMQLLFGCVNQYMRGVRTGGVREGKFAPKLIAWLSSADAATRQQFFLGGTTALTVVPMMAVDGAEGTVWDWLRSLYERDLGTRQQNLSTRLNEMTWLDAEDRWVSSLMRLSIERRDLADAAQQFVQASQYRARSRRASIAANPAAGGLQDLPMERSWKRLAAAIVHARKSHNISEDTFEQACLYGLNWNKDSHLNVVLVRLYHPTSPSVSDLCTHLRDPKLAANFVSSLLRASRTREQVTLSAVLDGAQLALSQGSLRDARFLLTFVQQAYPKLLPAASATPETSHELQTGIQIARNGIFSRSDVPFAIAYT